MKVYNILGAHGSQYLHGFTSTYGRSNYTSLETNTNVILKEIPLLSGAVTGWLFYSWAAGQELYLQVWRPTGTTDTYMLVAEKLYVTTKTGDFQQVSMPPVNIRSGDLIGLREVDRHSLRFITREDRYCDESIAVYCAAPTEQDTATFSPCNIVNNNVVCRRYILAAIMSTTSPGEIFVFAKFSYCLFSYCSITVVTVCCLVTSARVRCADGFTGIGTKCYYITRNITTFDQATQLCNDKLAILLSPKEEGENRELLFVMLDMSNTFYSILFSHLPHDMKITLYEFKWRLPAMF